MCLFLVPENAAKRCGNIETEEGTAQVDICFSLEDGVKSRKQLVRASRKRTPEKVQLK